MTDRATTALVDGLGAAAATSGVITQLQGRIFAFLYLQPGPVALDDIATGLGQSKSNVSIQIRGLLEWHLVRHTRLPGSRKDHYEAATDFWRVMQEIMERRFRWNLRQVLATVDETRRAFESGGGKAKRDDEAFVTARLAALQAFFTAVDVALGAFAKGKPFIPDTLQRVVALPAPRSR
jgi:DNA-binding transcriptional regulator GbsR (MarR family)